MRVKARVRLVSVCAIALIVAVAGSGPSSAAPLLHCHLTASATQSEISPGVYDWDLLMIGTCAGDRKGAYAAFGAADGTSQGLGLCDGTGVVQNLDLQVDLFLDSATGPQFSRLLQEHWFAPVTTFPLVTPFLIEDLTGTSDVGVGAGVLSEHIGLNCSPEASPSTVILSVRLT